LDNGVGLLPPLGWNTWCTLGPCGRDYCDEDEIMSVANVLITSGLSKLGWSYVDLDDCWGWHRAEDGTYQADPERFPSGMKSIAEFLHSKELKFGLYTDAGEYTCSTGGRPFKIPGSYGFYEQDAKTFASWGMDYIKMDWCNTDINGKQLRPEVQYAEMSRALNTSGRTMYFLSSEWGIDDPWKWMRLFANAWRVADDHHDNWKSTASIIEQAASIAQYAGPGGWNFLDFLMTGGEGCPDHNPGSRCPGMTDNEYRTEFTMWVMAASPLIVATDLRNMSAIQKEILFNTEILDIHQDKLGRAGGRASYWNCPQQRACQIWTKLLFDGSYYIALYNSGSEMHSITLEFVNVLGWIGVDVYVRDLWAHKDLGVFSEQFTTNVLPHGVAALKVYFTQ